MNALKDLLKSGKTVIGTTGGLSPDIPMIADSGFDFILFDTQHSAVESKQLIPNIQAMRGKKAAPVIRTSANRPELICFTLDAGARGLIVPMVNTKEDAKAMVNSCRYFPQGNRSNSGVRGEWGETKDYASYLKLVNKELVIIPMIETQQAIDNIDETLSVPGIDVYLVGPSDLSIEPGMPLDYENPKYQKALDKIVAGCKRHGVVPGMYFIPPNGDPSYYVEKGFKFFTMPWAPWATQGIKKALSGIKRLFPYYLRTLY